MNMRDPNVRTQLLLQMPSTIANSYELPSRNLQSILQRQSDVLNDLLRRE